MYTVYLNIFEGSLEVKLPTIWADEKQSRAEAERRDRLEERRSEKRKSQKKEDADAWRGRKVAKHCVFPMICGSGGSKSRLAKAAGAEPAGQMRDEKLHAVVARSTFRSQNVKNTTISDHFWRFRCRFASLRFTKVHYMTLHYTPLHYITLHYTPQHYNYNLLNGKLFSGIWGPRN